jgi:hypothetical protein
MRRPDAVCAQYRRPCGVTFSFQVCEYSIEPPEPNRCFNLLAKDILRSPGFDEAEHFGPEVSSIGGSFTLSGGGEWLTGTRAGPESLGAGVPCELECVGPTSDTGKKMALVEFQKIQWQNVLDTSLVNNSVFDMPSGNEISQPLGGKRIYFVVVSRHAASLLFITTLSRSGQCSEQNHVPCSPLSRLTP